jgi:predicted aspartyl protease
LLALEVPQDELEKVGLETVQIDLKELEGQPLQVRRDFAQGATERAAAEKLAQVLGVEVTSERASQPATTASGRARN